MKYLISLTAILFCLQALATEEKTVPSAIKEVTVYLNGAEIHRSGNTTLNAGSSTLVFKGLSPNIDKNSLQVSGKGNFTILSVVHRINYLKEQEKPKEIIVLEDSVESLNMKLEFQQSLQNVYANEEAMILANKSIGNKDVGVDALDLEEVADLFRKRLTEIQSKRLEAKAKQKKLRVEIAKLNKQLQSLNAKRNRSTGEIVVNIESQERTPAKFRLSYFIGNAGWIPAYDLRAKDTKSPVQLDYRAKVYQSSGVDWNNVKLTLSTMNPTRSGTKPKLNPWVLRYRTPVVTSYQGNANVYRAQAMGVEVMDEEAKPLPQAQTAASRTQVTQNQINTEFKIDLSYSIPTDGKQHNVNVQQHQLPATFAHYSAPKLDLDAFLLAQITGWENYKLLSGEASIYFDGTYVGKSFINTRITSDTLDLSFGRDKSVVITREKLKDFTSKKFIGTNKKETYAYEIAVRNTKKESITLTIEDQVPISSNKEIEVEIEEFTGAAHNGDSGKLKWTLNIQPGETKKLKLIYSVKYPKDKTIGNL